MSRINNSLMEMFFLAIYRFVIAPSLFFVLALLALLGHKKIRRGFKMRQAQNGYHPWFDLPRNTQPIWIHCASGEFEYAKPVIRNIKTRWPQQKVLVTYFSPTYKKNIESFPGVDMSCPTPWDFPGAWYSFVKHHQPKALLVARTDLWPEMLYQAKKLGIPSLLFSATKGKITNLDIWLRPFKKWLFNQFNVIYCVSQEDRLNFIDLGAKLVQAKGDTRYDQVFERLAHPKNVNEILLHQMSSRPLLLLGSGWKEDEEILLQACAHLIERKKMALIIAPHEPTSDHLSELEKQLKKHHLGATYYSRSEHWNENTCLIIDRVGVLAELYTYSDLAVIGGSFRGSVHSVMEALAAGCLTFVGPYHANNREALSLKSEKIDSLSSFCIVNEVRDSNELLEKIQLAIGHTTLLQKLRPEIVTKMKKKCGASLEAMLWIENLVFDKEQIPPLKL